MPPDRDMDPSDAYPRTWARLPESARRELRVRFDDPDEFPGVLGSLTERYGLPEYLPELAELEAAVRSCRLDAADIDGYPAELGLNPSLTTVHTHWKGLLDIMNRDSDRGDGSGESELSVEETTAFLWWDPFRGRVRLEPVRSEDALVLKLVAEGIDVRELAAEHGLSPTRLYTLLQRGRSKGLLLGPASRLRRPPEVAQGDGLSAGSHHTAQVFTLQWHVTNACDMRCRHCYGGGGAGQHMGTEDGYRVLREAAAFCREKNVRGQITFTGGNPLLHPDFFELYEAAVREGFLVAILGNPTDEASLRRLVAIEPPALFQVSLEGMREHNDFIRQYGHFDRVLDFLDRLREYGISSQVMLTLTRANLDQVLPLGEVLSDRADRFTFNRISLVGEGAALHPPDADAYWAFLRDYLAAARENPVLRLKDNLLNPALVSQGAEPFGGCTGFGCGAAFNFVALLPNGEVHACRKFPSPIGSIHDQTLAQIYDSSVAAAYRRAPEACLGCSLAPVCRGCPAVAHSFGGDAFRDRDPYCRGQLEPQLD